MKNCWRLTLGLIVLTAGLATAPVRAARDRPSRAEPTCIVWLKPERVPALRRPALARLLDQAVRGRPLRGNAVQDSRPRLVSEELAALAQYDDRATGGTAARPPGSRPSRRQSAPTLEPAKPDWLPLLP